MTQSPVLEAILKRRSIREFTDQTVTADQLKQIITAGIWAPSGLNNQPWRFVPVLDDNIKAAISEQTKYTHIVQSAAALICVFIDTKAMYHPIKDHQSMGACLQNMLLAVEAVGLGAVWLGEILKNKEQINRIVQIGDQFDLMAVLAIGHPAHRNQTSHRKNLSEVILKEL